jgi:hypothetical protein
MHVAPIVLPRDAEHDHALRFDEAFENARLAIIRPAGHNEVETAEDLFDGLMEFGFCGIPETDLTEDFSDVRRGKALRRREHRH